MASASNPPTGACGDSEFHKQRLSKRWLPKAIHTRDIVVLIVVMEYFYFSRPAMDVPSSHIHGRSGKIKILHHDN
jgi:hypothetical protein